MRLKLQLSLLMIVLINAIVVASNISDIFIKSGSKGLAIAIDIDGSPINFTSNRINGGFVLTFKEVDYTPVTKSVEKFTVKNILKSITVTEKNRTVTIKGLLSRGVVTKIKSKELSNKILFLVNNTAYPAMEWRISTISNNNASFPVTNEKETISSKPIPKTTVISSAQNKKSAIKPNLPVVTKSKKLNPESVVGGAIKTIKSGVNFRSSPTTAIKDNVIAVLEIGVKANLLSKQGNWVKIKTFNSGKVGWIHNSMIASIDSDDIDLLIIDDIPNLTTTKGKRPIAKIKKCIIKKKPEKCIRKYITFGRDPFLPLDKCDFLLPDLPDVENAKLKGLVYDDIDRVALITVSGNNGEEAFTLRENSPVLRGRVLKITPESVIFLLNEAGYSRKFKLRIKNETEE